MKEYRGTNRGEITLIQCVLGLLRYGTPPPTAETKLAATRNNIFNCFGVDRDGLLTYLGPKPSGTADIDHIIPKGAWVHVVCREMGYGLPYALVLALRLYPRQHPVHTARPAPQKIATTICPVWGARLIAR